MPPESKNGQPHTYPITQSELAEYRRLDGEIRRQLSILAYRRGQIMAGMGGMDRVEPGPLRPIVTYRDTGTYRLDEDEGQVEVLARCLTIIERSSRS